MPRYLWPARPESGDDASARGNFSGAFRPSSDVRNHDGTIDEPRAVEPVAPMVIRSRRTRGPAPLDAPVGDPITGATNLWLPVGPSVVMNGQASELANNEDVKEFYLGTGGSENGGDRKSFKDVKSYRRRKRWLA